MDHDEEQAINELMAMSREELDKVPYDLCKWQCQCKGCTNGTKVRDYGASPFFYFLRESKWYDLDHWEWTCGKHNKFRKRLLSRGYSEQHIWARLYEKFSAVRKVVRIKEKPQELK